MVEIKKFLKEAGIQIGAGGSAGFVEVCLMHPLDVVKTRLQLQARVLPNSPHHYSGIIDCFLKMRQHEGLFAFWKGILPPILAETPKRAVKTYSLAGACAGITEAYFVNPFEVVKVSLQSDKTHMSQVPSTLSVAKKIVKNQGLGPNGLYKGVTATVARNAVFNGIYFGFYHTMKQKIPKTTDHVTEVLYKLMLGFTSGVLGSCCNIPFDVAKSRIQGPQPQQNLIKYKSTSDTLLIIVREEGWRALFKGLLPKVMRLGPGGGIMLVVYEYTHDYLTKVFSS